MAQRMSLEEARFVVANVSKLSSSLSPSKLESAKRLLEEEERSKQERARFQQTDMHFRQDCPSYTPARPPATAGATAMPPAAARKHKSHQSDEPAASNHVVNANAWGQLDQKRTAIAQMLATAQPHTSIAECGEQVYESAMRARCRAFRDAFLKSGTRLSQQSGGLVEVILRVLEAEFPEYDQEKLKIYFRGSMTNRDHYRKRKSPGYVVKKREKDTTPSTATTPPTREEHSTQHAAAAKPTGPKRQQQKHATQQQTPSQAQDPEPPAAEKVRPSKRRAVAKDSMRAAGTGSPRPACDGAMHQPHSPSDSLDEELLDVAAKAHGAQREHAEKVHLWLKTGQKPVAIARRCTDALSASVHNHKLAKVLQASAKLPIKLGDWWKLKEVELGSRIAWPLPCIAPLNMVRHAACDGAGCSVCEQGFKEKSKSVQRGPGSARGRSRR
eukprot:jgi/Chlat1/2416/Chrsp17S02824